MTKICSLVPMVTISHKFLQVDFMKDHSFWINTWILIINEKKYRNGFLSKNNVAWKQFIHSVVQELYW